MSGVSSQEAVFALLADPATHWGEEVTRIDTHSASVFLVGDRAFKVKHAVRFPFLDYSTLELRKQACEAEVEINRPFAPGIYRGVVAITRAGDGVLALDGSGTPVEWAVEMRRFDANATLDRLADEGRIDAVLADALGRAVAAAHAAASPVAVEPWIGALGDYVEQNDSAFRALPELFPRDEADAITQASRTVLARIRPLLRERGRRSFVRRGHGDLHLGNIVLIDGLPVLFDAIEFDPLVASGDVLYDLAFLLMDLTERGIEPAANIVLNRYLAETRRTEDLDALAALPLFLSMRAAIRAKVTAARPARADPEKRGAIERSARRYFEFARRFLALPRPTLMAVGGLSGTGKSVLARALAPEIGPAPGAVVLRSDVERKTLFGKEESDKLAPEGYAPEVTARVYATITDKARRALAAGHSAIVDAVFARPQERAVVSRSAAALGVRFRGVFLDADLATRMARVDARHDDASDADAALARSQESYDLGPMDWRRVDASGPPSVTLARAWAAMRE
jgi:aminoglycoside phosphotransferase family enzyme